MRNISIAFRELDHLSGVLRKERTPVLRRQALLSGYGCPIVYARFDTIPMNTYDLKWKHFQAARSVIALSHVPPAYATTVVYP